MIVNPYFLYYYRLGLPAGAIKSKSFIILLYFVCIITFANFNCNNHKLKWVSKIKNNNYSRNAKFPMNNYGISLSSKVSDILCPSLVA